MLGIGIEIIHTLEASAPPLASTINGHPFTGRPAHNTDNR